MWAIRTHKLPPFKSPLKMNVIHFFHHQATKSSQRDAFKDTFMDFLSHFHNS